MSSGGDGEDSKKLRDVAITIHGTFAEDPDRSTIGNRWWQKSSNDGEIRSEFTDGLKTYWPSSRTIEIEPFPWSGENSESERKNESIRLRKLLGKKLREYDNVFVIGHSHAGNIIASAIQSQDSIWHSIAGGIKGKGSEKRLLFLTVGTPFFATENVKSIRKRNVTFWLFLVLSLSFIIIGFPDKDCVRKCDEFNFQINFSGIIDVLHDAWCKLSNLRGILCEFGGGKFGKEIIFSIPGPILFPFLLAFLICGVIWTPFAAILVLKYINSKRVVDPSTIGNEQFIAISDKDDEAIKVLSALASHRYEHEPQALKEKWEKWGASVFVIFAVGLGLIIGAIYYVAKINASVVSPPAAVVSPPAPLSESWCKGIIKQLKNSGTSLSSNIGEILPSENICEKQTWWRSDLLVVILSGFFGFLISVLIATLIKLLAKGTGLSQIIKYVWSSLVSIVYGLKLGKIFASLLNRMFLDTVKSFALGTDRPRTKIIAVQSNWRRPNWEPLCSTMEKRDEFPKEKISNELRTYRAEKIGAVVSKMFDEMRHPNAQSAPTYNRRQIESLPKNEWKGDILGLDADLLRTIYTEAGWIHTLYFETTISQTLIYFALQKRAKIGPSKKLIELLKQCKAYEAVCDAYDAILPIPEAEKEIKSASDAIP